MTNEEILKHTDEDMKLPAGKTCADCMRFEGCKKFIQCKGTNQWCDWAPSVFIEKKIQVTQG